MAKKNDSDLLHFAFTPDNKVLFDMKGNLPGKKVTLPCSRKSVDDAVSGSFFYQAFGNDITVDANLPDIVYNALKKNFLGYIAMAKKSAALVTGFEKTISMLKSGKAGVLIIADDAAQGSKDKILNLAKNSAVISLLSSSDYGQILGREKAVFIAVTHGNISDIIKSCAARLINYN